jgi:hypothetical protein
MTTSPDGQLVVAGMSNGMVQVYGADPEPHVTALQVGAFGRSPKWHSVRTGERWQ